MIIKDSLNRPLANGDILWYPRYVSRFADSSFNVCVIDDEDFHGEKTKKRVFVVNRHNALIPTYMSAFHRTVKINPDMLLYDQNNKKFAAILAYSLKVLKARRY